MSIYSKILDLLKYYRDRYFRLNIIAKDNYIINENKSISEIGEAFSTITKLTPSRSPESVSPEFPLGYQTIHNDGTRVNGIGLGYEFCISTTDTPPDISKLSSDCIFRYSPNKSYSNRNGQGGYITLRNNSIKYNSLEIISNSNGIDKNAYYSLSQPGPEKYQFNRISRDPITSYKAVNAVACKNYMCWSNGDNADLTNINIMSLDGAIILSNYRPTSSANTYNEILDMSPGNDNEVYILYRINKNTTGSNSYSIMKINTAPTTPSNIIISETIIDKCSYCNSEIKYTEVKNISGSSDGCYVGVYIKNSISGFIYIKNDSHKVYNNERAPVSTGNFKVSYSVSYKRFNIYSNTLSLLGFTYFNYEIIDYYGNNDTFYILYTNNDKYFIRKYRINSPVSTTAEFVLEWTSCIDLPFYNIHTADKTNNCFVSFDNDNLYIAYDGITTFIDITSGRIVSKCSGHVICINKSKYTDILDENNNISTYSLGAITSIIYEIDRSLGGYLISNDENIYVSQNLTNWSYIIDTKYKVSSRRLIFMDNNGIIYIANNIGSTSNNIIYLDLYSIDGIFLTSFKLPSQSTFSSDNTFFICTKKEKSSDIDVYFINYTSVFHITNANEYKVNQTTSIEVPKLIRGTSVISSSRIQLLNLDFIPEKVIISINDSVTIESTYNGTIKSSDPDFTSLNADGINNNNVDIIVPEKYNGFNYTYAIFGRYCKSV